MGIDNTAGNYQFADGKILVFAKIPVCGHVKTRLAAEIGDLAALQAYKYLLERTLHTAVSSKLSQVELWLDSEQQNDWLQNLTDQYAVIIRLQSGNDLGERMADAISKTLKEDDFCLLIGADCPLIDRNYLYNAFTVLQGGKEIVIGPAEDGGYVLVGMNQNKPALFSAIDWSTAFVLQQTRQIIKQQGWRHTELPVLWDIDWPADWQRWTSRVQTG